MEAHRIPIGEHEILVLATVPGLVSEGPAVQEALAAARPTRIGLGIPPEDLPALEVLAASDDPSALIPARAKGEAFGHGAPGLEGMYGVGHGADAEEDDDGFASLDPVHDHLMGLLRRFGDTRLPSPDLEAAYAHALQHDVQVQALDMDDDAHSDVYIAANKFLDVIRAGRAQRKLLAHTFDDAEDAHDLVRRFDAMQCGLRSLRTVEAAREAHMAKRLQEAGGEGFVAVVPLARIDGIKAHLG